MSANSRHIGIDVLAAERIYHCEMLADDRPHVIVVAILDCTNRVDAPGEVFDGLDQLTIAAQGELGAVEGDVQFEDAPELTVGYGSRMVALERRQFKYGVRRSRERGDAGRGAF